MKIKSQTSIKSADKHPESLNQLRATIVKWGAILIIAVLIFIAFIFYFSANQPPEILALLKDFSIYIGYGCTGIVLKDIIKVLKEWGN